MAQLGQVGKRLQIIKIAISITDRETISLQHSRLRLYKNDKLLQNILLVLDDENYAQASNLINRYLHGSDDEDATQENVAVMEEKAAQIEKKVLDMKEKISKEDKEKQKKLARKYRDIEEEELINKFGLFREKGREEIYNPIAKEEMADMAKEMFDIQVVERDTTNIPSTADIMASFDSIKEDIPIKASILDSLNKVKKSASYTNEEEVDPNIQSHEVFFNDTKDDLTLPPVVESVIKPVLEEDIELEDYNALEENQEVSNRELFANALSNDLEESVSYEGDKIPVKEDEEEDEIAFFSEDKNSNDEVIESVEDETKLKEYEPISYIDQKLRNMLNQYPQVEETTECFKSEERLLYMISLKGYTEEDIEKVVNDIQVLKEENKLGEASHLLLTIATTESLYAQFTLARELYQGVILVRDLPEAFTQINYLSTEQYPEAVCDLAQFYEHGIGIKKDKKRALSLYEDASELGVARASIHLNRLEKEFKGIFGKLFK